MHAKTDGRIRRQLKFIAGALASVAVAACSQSNEGLPADPNAAEYPGVGELANGLSALPGGGNCVFATPFSTKTLTFSVTSSIAVLSKNSAGAILLNGVACAAATTDSKSATYAQFIQATIDGTSTLILDYSGGFFALGSAGGPGVAITNTSSTQVKIRATPAADTIAIGTGTTSTKPQINLNNDKYVDITLSVAPSSTQGGALVISGGAGNDVISGAGNSVVGGAYAGELTLYGGAGADTLTGGAGADTIWGGDGNDLLSGGVNSSTGTIDYLFGEAGNDTFNAASASTTVYAFGGPGTDTFDYSKRTADLFISASAFWHDSSSTLELAQTPATDLTFVTSTDAAGNVVITPPYITAPFNYSATGTLSGLASAPLDLIGLDIEIVLSGSGNDQLIGNGLDSTVARSYLVKVVSGTSTATLPMASSTVPSMKNAAANTLNGGAGDDTFWELASSSTNIYVGGTGVNKIDYSLRVSSTLNILLDGKAHSGEANENDTIGTDFRDAVGGSSSTNFITGNSLANVLKGGPFSTSTLTGLDGDDTLYAIGADTLVGGNGDDTFILPATQLVANVSVDCGAGTGNTIDWSLNPTSTIIALGFGTTSTTDGSGFHVTIAGTADTCNNAVAGQGTSDPTGIPSTIFGNSLDNILDGNASSVAGTWITGGGGVNTCLNMQSSSTYCQ